MKTFVPFLLFLCVVLAADVHAQSGPKTSDISEEIAPDGSVKMNFRLTFDAAPWRQWKEMVGEEPARLRAMMRHQFSVLTLEDFKLERDDMNRVAQMSMRSNVGPEIRDDGSYQVPVDGYFRLVNNAGPVWFFSGNNPHAGYTLNNVKLTLPANATDARVINEGKEDQELVFALTPAPSPSRWFYLSGVCLALLGLGSVIIGLLLQPKRLALPAATPPPFLPATPVASTLPPATPPPFVAPPPVPQPPTPIARHGEPD